MKTSEKILYLKEFVTEKRFDAFNKVLDQRTRYISVVLEDIFQSHNASAVLRSCDCFGVQDIHLIENNNKFSTNPQIALGSSQWLSKIRHNQQEQNTLNTINFMRENNYRIVATTPHTQDCLIKDLDITKGKIALFFGQERPGLSDIVMENADEFVKIPMVGFTESFNISVSAALCLYELSIKLKKSDINWQLSQNEKDKIMLDWLKTSIKDSGRILNRLYQNTP